MPIEPRQQSARETLVSVTGVSKKFCRSLKKSLWYGLQDMAGELNPFRRPVPGNRPAGEPGTLRAGEFWAVRDVSFELRRGECLGLIGHNGAGKTTLLKMLNGLISPDCGSITMRGRVGALIALGAGFNPVLTGRENVYVNASILGLSSRETEDRLEEIIEFSGIGEFIDAPVQSYSSGMQVRLGFAVATALEPDILILDEILAVGDASFRHRCYQRINRIMKNCAVILVSHSMEQIAAVARSVGFMDHGRFTLHDDPLEGVLAYNEANASDASAADGGRVFAVYPPFTSVKVHGPSEPVSYLGPMEIEVEIHSEAPIEHLVFSFSAVNRAEQTVMNWNLRNQPGKVRLPAGRSRFRFRISSLQLHPGNYQWNLWIGPHGAIEPSLYAMRAGGFRVTSRYEPIGDIPYLPVPDEFEVIPLREDESLMVVNHHSNQ
jgi:lipopolysaccharide transport system ATP-binding protein